MRYVFGEWCLDTQRAELSRAGEVRRLRRKVCQVLAYLLAQADRVVSKHELYEQIWPQQFVSDAALESVIKAVRQALGDNGRDQRLIQTVYGQGYRCVAAVTAGAPASPASVSVRTPRRDGLPPGLAEPRTPVVGREGELMQLSRWWARVQEGERHLVVVTGEPGMGKTTLVDAFLHRLTGETPCDIARGQCVEPFGVGEPYRPVLEALGRLGRGPRGPEVVAVLEAQAPTWLAQLPGLVALAPMEAGHRPLTGVTRARMLRELAEALEVLTAQQALVLVLEDLHWSDPSTLDLLAVVARRREPARLLLLVTARPPEGRPGGHPLAAVLHELQRHGHSVELPVPGLTEAAMAVYCIHRVPGLRRVDALARQVSQYTEGHPLFMVLLVDAWLTEGRDLAQEGTGGLGDEREARHAQVPDSVRQLIEGQLDRLSPTAQRVLETASVAGVEFSAAVVAAGLRQAVEHVDEACAALARRGSWLRAVGDEGWPDGTVAGRYRFGHALYQQVLYGRVAAARRGHLHQRIGLRVEGGYGTEAATRAAELAMHFVQGRDDARAVLYLRQAGVQALQRSSHHEAHTHLLQGLDLLPRLPATPARVQQELEMLRALGLVLIALRGYAAPEVEQTYARARTLCAQGGEPAQVCSILRGLATYYQHRGALRTARELREQCLRLAQQADEPTYVLEAHLYLGLTLTFLGDYPRARLHLEQGRALTEPRVPPVRVQRSSIIVPDVACLLYAVPMLWSLGYPVQALRRSQDALAQALAHPYSLAMARHFAAFLHYLRRDAVAVQAEADALLTLATTHAFPYWAVAGRVWQGWAGAMLGAGEVGVAQICQALAATEALEHALARPVWLVLLAEAAGHGGHVAEGLEWLAEARTAFEGTGRGDLLAEAYRLQGTLLVRQAGQHAAQAEACFQQALAVARRQQAKSWELRAAMSLSRLWQQQGKRAEAHALLAPVYGWFTEGFDTADLQEARTLLEELRG